VSSGGDAGDRGGRPRPTRRFRLVAWLVIGCLRLARWRIDVRGLERVPATGGLVVVWSHHGHVDFLAAAMHLYLASRRPIRFLAVRDLWSSTGL
jgi:1-acyl-sn-glycerol-3-phosphate acyltransferase